MLPNKLRLWLFDRLSVKTMRYVTAVPAAQAQGLTRRVYDMIQDDFFMNGSLTSRSRVPELMAAIWTSGRETMIVDDHLDRTTKEAICGVLSDINDCPYCGDMLVSLVHAGDQDDAAKAVHGSRIGSIEDPKMRRRLAWVEAVTKSGTRELPPLPFSIDELPEVLGSMMGMADINRFSHVVMDGSPVQLPGKLQSIALRVFGGELRATKRHAAVPGRALCLLPAAPLPSDLDWAASNPRIADALGRWAATVEHETRDTIPDAVRATVSESLARWNNEQMPISRAWVEDEVAHLRGEERLMARLAIVLAKAPYQVGPSLVEPLVARGEDWMVRFLSWAAFTGARRFIGIVADRAGAQLAAGTSERQPALAA